MSFLNRYFFSKFKKTDLVFFILFVIVSAFYYDSVLDKGPIGVHLWRQTDCLSITKNYYDGASFLSPELHAQLADEKTSGKSAGEFPIMYYTVAQLWKITGVSYMTFRITYLLLVFAGLFCFYRALLLLLKNAYWSILLSLLLFTSPVFAFYGVSFLTDVPAFCFILVSFYFLTKYIFNNRLIFYYTGMFFIALAGLIKVSHLIFFAFLCGIYVLELFPVQTLGNRKFFTNKIYELFGLLFVIISIYSWYSYAAAFNDIHHFKYTFNDIYPIWLVKDDAIEPLIKGIKDSTSVAFFSRPILFSFLVLGIFNFFLIKRIPLFAYLANITVIIGCTFYFCFWAPLFQNHDYYLMALLILFPGILIPFVYYVKNTLKENFNSSLLKVFISIFYVFNFIYCIQVMKLKTLTQEGNYIFVGNQRFVEEMRWINWELTVNARRFEESRPYLEKIGIDKNDKVISLPDASFSISLFLMDRKGWSNFQNYTTTEQIQELVDKGAAYLVLSDPSLKDAEYLQPFLHHPIGEFKGIYYYRLTNIR